MSTNKRKSEKSYVNARYSQDRYFAENGEWYYYARRFADGNPQIFGPYLTKIIAIKNCNNRFTDPKIRKPLGIE